MTAPAELPIAYTPGRGSRPWTASLGDLSAQGPTKPAARAALYAAITATMLDDWTPVLIDAGPDTVIVAYRAPYGWQYMHARRNPDDPRHYRRLGGWCIGAPDRDSMVGDAERHAAQLREDAAQ